MSFTTTVENGQVVLPAGIPDGTVLRIEIEKAAEIATLDEASMPTLLETMKDFVGVAEGLPTDMAANHNHYIHGHPKA